MDKKRVIVDYRNITQEMLQLLTDTYPYGYDDAIIKFKNAKGEWVSTVPMETTDTKFLVKVGIELERKVEAFLDDDDDDTDSNDGELDIDVADDAKEDDD